VQRNDNMSGVQTQQNMPQNDITAQGQKLLFGQIKKPQKGVLHAPVCLSVITRSFST